MRRACPVCEGRIAYTIHTQNLVIPDGLQFPSRFDVVACSSCGMVYSDLDAVGLGRYYASTHYRAHDDVDVDRLAGVADLLADLFPTSSRVLDLGCASGELLIQLGKVGFEYLRGIELSQSAVAAAQERGLTVGHSFPDEKFDLITISHVLEHVQHPREFLTTAIEHLSAGGSIYIEVPDAGRYVDHLHEPFLDFNLEHINHFTIPNLILLMNRLGFSGREWGEKVIAINRQWDYPAFYGVFTRRTTPITRYVTACKHMEAEMDRELLRKLNGRRQVAVRGFGQFALRRLASPLLSDLEVVAYVDADPDKWRLSFNGVQVQSPEVPLPPDVPVLVLTIRDAEEIRAEYPGREVICERQLA